MFRYLYYNENNWEKDWDCIVPIVDGRKHPLAAIYVDVSDDPQYRNMLSNINTPEEYKRRCLVEYS